MRYNGADRRRVVTNTNHNHNHGPPPPQRRHSGVPPSPRDWNQQQRQQQHHRQPLQLQLQLHGQSHFLKDHSTNHVSSMRQQEQQQQQQQQQQYHSNGGYNHNSSTNSSQQQQQQHQQQPTGYSPEYPEPPRYWDEQREQSSYLQQPQPQPHYQQQQQNATTMPSPISSAIPPLSSLPLPPLPSGPPPMQPPRRVAHAHEYQHVQPTAGVPPVPAPGVTTTRTLPPPTKRLKTDHAAHTVKAVTEPALSFAAATSSSGSTSSPCELETQPATESSHSTLGAANTMQAWDTNETTIPPSPQSNHDGEATTAGSILAAIGSGVTTTTTTMLTTAATISNKGPLEQARTEARLRLRDALLAKKQALLENARPVTAPHQSQTLPPPTVLPPISALLKGNAHILLIANIRESGSANMVRFAATTILAPCAYDDDGIDNSSSNDSDNSDMEMSESDDHNLSDEEKTKDAVLPLSATSALTIKTRTPVKSPLENMVLLKRKLELQSKIVEAKEKKQQLQLQQQEREKVTTDTKATTGEESSAAANANANARNSTAILNREELEKRRDVAARHRSITHFKHLISKQEHLLAEQDATIQSSREALEECQQEYAATQLELRKTNSNILRFQARGQVVDQSMAETTSKLIQARQKLHNYKVAYAQ